MVRRDLQVVPLLYRGTSVTTIAISRAMLERRFPYFVSVLFGLTMVATDEIPTLAVSTNMVLAYNPDYLLGLSEEEGLAVLFHEITHVTDSFILGEAQTHPNFNKAADLHINCRCKSIGLKLPAGVLFPEQFHLPDNLSTLQYLEKLGDKTLPSGQRAGEGNCWMPPELQEKYAGRGKSPLEKAAIEEQLAKDISAHAGKGRGSVPGDLLEWAKVRIAPASVPWYRVLAGRLRGTLSSVLNRDGTDTYNRPHELAFLDPTSSVLLPGEEYLAPDILLILDTSGSMTEDVLELALREMRGVLASLGVRKLWLLHADTRVQKEEEIFVAQLQTNRVQLAGRGGTSFIQPLERARQKKAVMVVYMTDGDGAFPERPPAFPVIWLYLKASHHKAPFGVTIHVDE